MPAEWELYSFYRVLGVNPGADSDEIKSAYQTAVSTLDPDAAPQEEKRMVALARLAVDAAFDALSDEKSRKECDTRLGELQTAASKKKKIEAARKGKLQEQQTIEEDEKLQKATQELDSAVSALADLYYDQLFKRAKETGFDTIPSERLLEWLSSEQAESAKSPQQRGGRLSFRIDWRGFTGIQDKRKERSQEIAQIVEELLAKRRTS